jgi:sporulation protein YlmC with PRC-barrel domain
MIRNLMASSAILALLAAGAVTAQAEDTAKPAATQELPASTAAMKIQQPTLLSIFMGKAVYSSEDPQSDNIGDVNDLVIGNNGVVTHAVIGVGGFLGIGEKDVAVPFDDLKILEKDGDIRLIYGATREQLTAAPAIDRATYQSLQNPEAATTVNEPAVQDNSVDQQTAASDAKPAAADDASITLDKDQILATNLIGNELYGPDDNSFGEISDLVLQNDGKTRAVLIDVGGFLGIGEKTVAIPFEEIKLTQAADGSSEPKLVAALTKEQVEKLPQIRTDVDTAAAEPTSTPAQDAQATNVAMTDDECNAAWVSADANQDGTLDANESARYLAALRVANKTATDTTLTHPVFLENCKAGYFVDTAAAEPGAPFEGANSFTEGQAQDRVLAAGFSNVSPLTKDDKGIWRGTAEAQGKKVNVAVDYKGNVVTTNM